jgi:hypothetical protein
VSILICPALLLTPSASLKYVFTYEGRRIRWGVDVGFNTIKRKAGLEDITLHTLRHTFASQLVIAGVPLRYVHELMGHQSFETTLQYAHLSEEHVKNQVLPVCHKRWKKCASGAEMKTVEYKTAHEEASDEQKVTLGSHRDIFLASWNYPQLQGTAPKIEKDNIKARGFFSEYFSLYKSSSLKS